MERYYLPALKGRIGDWWYYSCLMSMPEVVKRIKRSDELYKNKQLSDMVQREISRKRPKEIENYLFTERERFFSAMIVAVFGGAPDWHSFEITAGHSKIDYDDLSLDTIGSFGFLSFSGGEKLFPLDGQHRLEGMRRAIRNKKNWKDVDDFQLDIDEVPVIFVAHEHKSEEGRQRSRRLFTSLNKRAVPVNRAEVIALDEDDVAAIATRHLVENVKFFDSKRISTSSQTNLPPTDRKHFTSLGTLYVVLDELFQAVSGLPPKHLHFNRPDEKWMKWYLTIAEWYFEKIAVYVPAFQQFVSAKKPTFVVQKYRHKMGGNLLFRTAGLRAFTGVIASLVSEKRDFIAERGDVSPRATLTSTKRAITQAVKRASELPMDLKEPPLSGVLWAPASRLMKPRNMILSRDILLNMISPTKKAEKLRERYAKALELPIEDVELPFI